jgi:hypothetical protein
VWRWIFFHPSEPIVFAIRVPYTFPLHAHYKQSNCICQFILSYLFIFLIFILLSINFNNIPNPRRQNSAQLLKPNWKFPRSSLTNDMYKGKGRLCWLTSHPSVLSATRRLLPCSHTVGKTASADASPPLHNTRNCSSMWQSGIFKRSEGSVSIHGYFAERV